MANEFAPIAELFAVLGLDAKSFDDQLMEVKVRLKDVQPVILTVQQAITRLKSEFALAAEDVGNFNTAVQLVHDQRKADALKASDEQAAIAFKSQEDASRIAAIQATRLAEEKSVRANAVAADKAMQVDMEAAHRQQIESERAYNAEMDAAFRVEMERLEKSLAARKAEIEEERYLNQQAAEARRAAALSMQQSLPFMSAYGGSGSGPGGTGGGDRAGLGVRFGQGGIMPFIRISQNISAAIGPLMDVLFPIALMGLAVDIMDTYMKNIQGVANALSGAADQSERLALATKNMLTAIEKQADDMTRIDRMARTEGVSVATVRARVSAVDTPATRLLQAQIEPMAKERDNLQSIIAELKGVPTTYGRNLAAQLMGTKLGMVGAQDFTAEGIAKRKTELDEKIIEVTNHKVRIQEEEVRSMYKHVEAQKKWLDEVHELPNKLPWFMGGGMTWTGTLPGGWPQAVNGANMPFQPIAGAPIGRTMGSPRSTPQSGPVTASTASGSSGVTIYNNFSPVYNFDGIPADVESFMRNKAEPALIEHLGKNTRGVTAEVVRILRRAGIGG